MASKVLSIILAGGEGKRLMPLTHFRAKPAVPFGGTYRLIDFPLSNLINSGYRHTFILTQYKSQSLARHIASSWAMSPITGEFTSIVPAQQSRGDHWYLGSADAIYQTLNLVSDYDPDIILILGADNVYRMDYSQMIEEHIKSGAEFTITGIRQPIELADQFGVIQTCDNDPHKIEQFLEKPKNAKGLPDNPNEIYASMGNYVANADVFIEALKKDAESLTSKHDMGGDIVPYFVKRKSAYVYDFTANSVPGDNLKDRGYWRDVGTIDQYFEANMDLIAIDPTFNLYNFEWPIITSQTGLPPAKFVHDEQNRKGVATNSIVSQGVIISGGHVSNSVLSPRVKINSWADVHRSILFDNVYVGRKAQIKNAIIDKNAVIASGIQIGYDLDLDRKRGLTVTDSGIVVVPRDTIIEK